MTQVYCSLACNSKRLKVTYMLSIAGWLYKLWYTPKMEYYAATKKNKEVLYVLKGTDRSLILTEKKSYFDQKHKYLNY